MFNKKEIFSLIIALIILTFVFGFNDKSEVFVFTNWLSHFLYVFFVVLIVLFVKELGHKVFALWRDCDVKFEIWSIKSLWFSKASEFKNRFRIGLWLPIFGTILTNGWLPLTFVGEHKIKGNKLLRTGGVWVKVSDYERNLICFGGFVFLGLFLIILNVLSRKIGMDIDLFVRVIFFVMLFNYLPFHRLDGAYIFFGGRFVYIFGLVFLILCYILFFVSFWLFVILGGLIGLILIGIIFYNWTK